MKTYWDIDQRSQEWFDIKHGKMSASKVSNLFSKTTKLPYLKGLAYSKIKFPINADEQGFLSKSVQRGVDYEDAASIAFQRKLGIVLKPCGFIHILNYFGISPDGINEDMTIGLEIKVFEDKMMGEVALSDEPDLMLRIPKKHRHQVLSYFMIPTIHTVYFMIFGPEEENVNGEDFAVIIRIERKDVESDIEALKTEIEIACDQIQIYRDRL